MEKKPCRKCLLKEIDPQAYMDQLHKYIELLDKDVKSPQNLYENRLNICKECDYLNEGTCQACGCFVELRAAVRKNKCPYKKWT